MGSRLFVGNLPYSCTEDDLRQVFRGRWAITDVRIVTDRETGRSKGFGFVELDTEDATRQAIDALDGSEAFGRRLAVREAHERPGGGTKPKRGRVESRPEVATVVRRSSARPGAIPRAVPESDGRRWQAPPEPEGLGEWAAEDRPSRK
jgi:RNA recognition motif-containing protein